MLRALGVALIETLALLAHLLVAGRGGGAVLGLNWLSLCLRYVVQIHIWHLVRCPSNIAGQSSTVLQ